MSLIPKETLQARTSIPLAPMIDFLFLMLIFFASLAVSRVAAKDTSIDLVEIQPETHASRIAKSDQQMKVIHLNITSDNEYQWETDLRDYLLPSAEAIKAELVQQYTDGLLPEDPTQTHVLLKIDRNAQWEPILQALFAIRDAGFEARPVYEPLEGEQV